MKPLEFNDLLIKGVDTYEISFISGDDLIVAEIETDIQVEVDSTFHSDVHASENTCDFKKSFFRIKKVEINEEPAEVEGEIKKEIEAIAETQIEEKLIYQSEFN